MKKFMQLVALFVLLGMQVYAQTTITGTVTNQADGTPIPGATVRAKGFTDVGTITDLDGKYTLTGVPTGATALIFSFVGMKTIEVPITGTVVNAQLQSEDVAVGDVVVTAMGITRQPRELGYSITKVDNELMNQGKSVRVVNSLTAKVAGLQVNTTSSGVDADTRMTLRGNRSFTGDNTALYVLDGVPTSSGIANSMNPNDIESVTILKGANASALYGSEAANGVVVITTKKGSKDNARIEFSNTTTFESVSFMPKMQTRFGAGSGVDANGYPVYAAFENQCYGPEYDGSIREIGRPLADGSIQKITYEDRSNEKRNFFETGVTIQNSISYTGGDEKNQFYISAQDAIIKGTVPNDEARRSTIRFNGTRKSGNLKLGYNTSYTHFTTDVAGASAYQARSVYWLIMNTPGNIPLTNYKNWQTDPYSDLNGYFNDYYENPYVVIGKARNRGITDIIVASADLEYKIFPYLTALARTTINYTSGTYRNIREAYRFSDYAASSALGRTFSSKGDYPGTTADGTAMNTRWTNDFMVTFDKRFNDFSTKAVAGFTMRQTYARTVDIAANALKIDGWYNINNRIGDPATLTSAYFETSFAGAYFDVTFGYKDYVFIHASIRNDWTSVLKKGNNSFSYPGVDVSVILTEAIPSLKKYINFGKLRAGIAKVGTINVGAYQLQNIFRLADGNVSAAYNFPYGNMTAFSVDNTLNNDNLLPESTISREVGLELGLFNSKLNLSLAYYMTNTKDQTVPVDISQTTGYARTNINTGDMESSGFEVEAKYTVLHLGNGLTWEVGCNYTYQTSKVKSILSDGSLKEINLGGFADGRGIYAVLGEDYPAIKATDYQRDPQGRVIIDPQTGYPLIGQQNSLFGCTSPKHILGLNTTFKYKGFTLGIVAEYRAGAIIWNNIGDDMCFTGLNWVTATNGRQRMVFPNSVYKVGDVYVPNTDIVTSNGGVEFFTNTFNTADFPFITSSDFWKIREVSLTYQIPSNVLPKFIKGATIGFVARNLFTFLPASNIYTDPEFNFGGGNAVGLTTIGQTPPTRSYGFNISVNF